MHQDQNEILHLTQTLVQVPHDDVLSGLPVLALPSASSSSGMSYDYMSQPPDLTPNYSMYSESEPEFLLDDNSNIDITELDRMLHGPQEVLDEMVIGPESPSLDTHLIELGRWLSETSELNRTYVNEIIQQENQLAWPESMDVPANWQQLLIAGGTTQQVIIHRFINLMGQDTWQIVLRENLDSPDELFSPESGTQANMYNGQINESPDTEPFEPIKIPAQYSKELTTQQRRVIKHGLFFQPKARFIIAHKPKRSPDNAMLSQFIHDLIKRGIVIQVDSTKNTHRYLAFPFLIKTPRKIRMVVNYSQLSRRIAHIKMTLPFYGKPMRKQLKESTSKLLAITIDLRDAFYQLKVAQPSQKFTTFSHDDKCYQFTRLPMGLGPSPGILQIILTSIFKIFSPQPAFMWTHVDDILLIASRQWFDQYLHQFLQFLALWNISVNFKKSHLSPSPIVEYCGTILNLQRQTIILTQKKLFKLAICLILLLENPRPRLLQKIHGFLVFIIPILNLPFHILSLPTNQLVSLILQHLHGQEAYSICPWHPTVHVAFSDASLQRAAAILPDHTIVTYDFLDDTLPIHWCEMVAFLMCILYVPRWTCVYVDNSIIKFNANARNWRTFGVLGYIADFIIQRKQLHIAYVPSCDNPVDAPSRRPEIPSVKHKPGVPVCEWQWHSYLNTGALGCITQFLNC